MLKVLLAAILVALVTLIVLLLPTARPERTTPASVAVNGPATPPPPSSSFVVHNEAPPTVAPPAIAPPASTTPAGIAPPADPDSLEAVMQRLRAAKPGSTFVIAPTPISPPTAPAPTPSIPSIPAVPAVVPVPAAPEVAAAPTPAPVLAPAPQRWSNVSGQGVRFRVGRIGDGYVISIDLGGGEVADVHVLAAFGRLDQTAVNMRVDYLKQTILENFPPSSASYSYNRDGSVTRER